MSSNTEELPPDFETFEVGSFDEGCLAIGNMFKTKEAALKHVEYLKALQIIRGDTKGYEYKVGDTYWSPSYSNSKGAGRSEHNDLILPGIKFKEESDIESSFKLHKKEWLIVLGIE